MHEPHVHHLPSLHDPRVDPQSGAPPASHHEVRFLERPGERMTATHCCFCGMQCGMLLRTSEQTGHVVGVEPRYDWPVNEGRLCPKGVMAYTQLDNPDRLLRPLIRRNGRLMEADWEDALQTVVRGIRSVQEKHGKDAMAVYSGSSMTNEKCYLAGKFARIALGTRHIDYNGRLCMSSAGVGYKRAFGIDRPGCSFTDVLETDLLFVCGSNTPECHPTGITYLWKALDNGARLIVADPRETHIARTAHLHLRLRPGTDMALYMAMLHVLIAEDMVDHEFLRDRVNGWEETKESVRAMTPGVAAEITGLIDSDIIKAARWFGRAKSSVTLHARGIEHHAHGSDNVNALINVGLACGRVGKPGCGTMTLTGQGNGQGGREHGQKAEQLPGYRYITDPAARAHVAKVWKVPEEWLPGPGYSAVELFEAMGRREIRGLYLLCSNPMVSLPAINRVENAIKHLDFFVAADFFLSETARLADVVLPVAMWAEDEGTVTNVEGRVIKYNKAAEPPPDIPTDWQLMCELARRLGRGEFFPFTEPRQIFDELRHASRGGIADYYGITYEKVEAQKGVFWPCPSLDHPGTPRLFEDGRFYHQDGKAVMLALKYIGPKEEPDAAYPMRYTTGRVVYHYLSGNQTRRIPFLHALAPDPYVEIHPATAAQYGIKPGDFVRVESRRGHVVLRAQESAVIRPDTVFVPYHWGDDIAANLLTIQELDPYSKMPELKACAVRIAKTDPPPDQDGWRQATIPQDPGKRGHGALGDCCAEVEYSGQEGGAVLAAENGD
jgi:assimilatory nitrate reductase catalytic subunit